MCPFLKELIQIAEDRDLALSGLNSNRAVSLRMINVITLASTVF